jgi:hypothetical protein
MHREVTMIEIKKVLRLRGEGLPKERIASQLETRSENRAAPDAGRGDCGHPSARA